MKAQFFYYFAVFILIIPSCQNDQVQDHLSSNLASKNIAGDTARLNDIVTGLSVLVEYDSDIENANTLEVLLRDSKRNVIDSVIFKDLLFSPKIRVEDNKFLIMEMPMRAGLGNFIEKTVILTSFDQTFKKSLDIITTEKVSIGDEKEDYQVLLKYDNTNIKIDESFSIPTNSSSLRNFEFKTALKFMKDKSIFYNDLMHVEKNDSLPLIRLQNLMYSYQNEEWTILDIE